MSDQETAPDWIQAWADVLAAVWGLRDYRRQWLACDYCQGFPVWTQPCVLHVDALEAGCALAVFGRFYGNVSPASVGEPGFRVTRFSDDPASSAGAQQ